MRYESANFHSKERVFDTLQEALDNIKGSKRDLTRPWVRVASGDESEFRGRFLIIRGQKTLPVNPIDPPLLLTDADQKILDAWICPDPAIQHLLDEIDLCNNGYLRVDCMDKDSRLALAEAVASGQVVLSPGMFGVQIVHRPELKPPAVSAIEPTDQEFKPEPMRG